MRKYFPKMKRLWQRVVCALRGVHGDYEAISFRGGRYSCQHCGRWWIGDVRAILASGRAAQLPVAKVRP
jgi:hypothetical protein